MNSKLIQIGIKKYINPHHIVAVYERNEFWFVRIRDGGEFLIEETYINELLRKLSGWETSE